MFGAFKPSASLSGGLLWKIPWRLSPPQKLRHRRRMRRVDNIVAVLDNALKREPPSLKPTPQPSPKTPTEAGNGTPSELAQTAQGQRILSASANSASEARRHGRGPKQGEMVPEQIEASSAGSSGPMVQKPSGVFLGDQARAQGTIKLIERWKAEMPTEQEMLAKDKYTMFDRKAKGYRKGVHKLPKWTRVSQRLNPPGF